MSGWYRLHRGWQDHAVFRNEPFSRRDAFVWLIENAAYERVKIDIAGAEHWLERGQVGHSLRFMAKAWKWDEARVRRFIASLRKAQIIDATADAGQTVITIRKYEVYQTRERVADAASDAAATQDRRSTDAKYKEGKKEEEKGRERADGRYAFEGGTIKLTADDLAKWTETYSGIPDLRAELSSIDGWFAGQAEGDRKGWFHRTQRMLNAKHQERLAKDGAAKSTVVTMDDAFLRRLERAQASGAVSAAAGSDKGAR
ncbi:ribosomal protein L12E/L44/L45/RPP1/RPP2 [Sphingomonas sp. BE138]|uniref:hypothetical protein n=1 Tax=Sphingomonas sp. BE138 TaxID=2817845 RepID=UPI002862F116|nr:hypothetical protein [Sphingomonas sp. BE138]MDR6789558.1 ribosomal protein L12E/L44/L45/RPP1/RPP2 [Sphingomonas sp. BE138]